jgi:hypothetical protein
MGLVPFHKSPRRQRGDGPERSDHRRSASADVEWKVKVKRRSGLLIIAIRLVNDGRRSIVNVRPGIISAVTPLSSPVFMFMFMTSPAAPMVVGGAGRISHCAGQDHGDETTGYRDTKR